MNKVALKWLFWLENQGQLFYWFQKIHNFPIFLMSLHLSSILSLREVLWGKWRVQQLKKWRLLVKRRLFLRIWYVQSIDSVWFQLVVAVACSFLEYPRNGLLKEAKNLCSNFIIWVCLPSCVDVEVWCVTISLEANRSFRDLMDQIRNLPSFSSCSLSFTGSLTPCVSWSFCFSS